MKTLSIFLCVFQIGLAEIVQVIEIMRHGAREPLSDLYNGKEFRDIWGELTSVGMREHFLLGRELREKYIKNEKFLKPYFNVSEVYIQSTDYNRTIVSAISHLQGLFDLAHPEESKFSEEILFSKASARGPKWEEANIYFPPILAGSNTPINGTQDQVRPFPIHTVNKSEDYLLRNYRTCKICDANFKDAYNGKTMLTKKFQSEFTETYAKIKEFLKRDNLTFWQIGYLKDEIISNEFKGLTNLSLDKKLSKELLFNLTFLFNIHPYVYYHHDTQPEDLKRAVNTPFAKFVQENFRKSKSDGGFAKKKFMLLSSHDNTLQQILFGFNLTNWQCMHKMFLEMLGIMREKNFSPETFFKDPKDCLFNFTGFASHILLELHKNKNQTFSVKFILNGLEMNICPDSPCSFEDFDKELTYLQHENYESLCGNSFESSHKPFTDNINPSFIGFSQLKETSNHSDPFSDNNGKSLLLYAALVLGIILEVFLVCFLTGKIKKCIMPCKKKQENKLNLLPLESNTN